MRWPRRSHGATDLSSSRDGGNHLSGSSSKCPWPTVSRTSTGGPQYPPRFPRGSVVSWDILSKNRLPPERSGVVRRIEACPWVSRRRERWTCDVCFSCHSVEESLDDPAGHRTGHVGSHHHARSVGPHPRRFAQPRPLRRGPRGLHVLRAVRDVRPDLSLRDVAAAPADGDVLAARLAGVLPARLATAQRRHVGSARRRRRARQPLHLRAGSAARAHAHADHVGMPDRRGDHLSSRLRLAALSVRLPGDLSLYEAVAFGFPAFRFPARVGDRVRPVPRTGVGVVPGDCRA